MVKEGLKNLEGVAPPMATESIDSSIPEGSSLPTRQHDVDSLQQYYVAVDRQQFKMGTLVDLLDVLGRKDGLPIVMCCCSRDGLDAVCGAFSASRHISVTCLHSDLGESESRSVMEVFRGKTRDWNHILDIKRKGEVIEESMEPQSHLLVLTDSCLPHVLGESPLCARVVINYDLPSKKEGYQRRLTACLGPSLIGAPAMARGIVINMVVGGEVALLRNIEEGCAIIIEEMPIHISELL